MTEPRWLNPAERATWIRLVAILELLPSALDAQLEADSDLDLFEYQVLVMLESEDQHRVQMSTLAVMTNAKIARLSRVITRLEKRGLVRREPSETDRRATYARLTSAGMSVLEEAAPGHVRFVRERVVDALTPAEFEQLGAISQKLLASLDPDLTMFRARHGNPPG